jgi:Ca-activated chloride channel homolog
VRPNEDIEASVSKLYRRIGAPVMTDVTLKVDVEGAAKDAAAVVNRLYPKGTFDLFAGDQVVLVGRYHAAGAAKVTLTGNVGGKQQSFDFPATLAEKSDDDSNAFVAKLWATRRVGEIIDEIDLKGKNEELVNELVSLATEHGILTPYTSFFADETSDVRALTLNRARTLQEVESLDVSSGKYGVDQRGAKLAYQTASRASESIPASAAPPVALGGGGRAGGAAPMDLYSTGSVRFYDAKEDRQVQAQNIRQIGRKTFFQRGQRWVDSTVSDDDEKKAQKVDRYSREYFDLMEKYGKHVAQYLAFDEPVVVKLGDQTYEW